MSSELEVFLWDSKVHGLPDSVDQASDMSVALESLPSPPTAALLRFADRVAAAEREAGVSFTHHGSVPEYVKTHDVACLRLELSSENPHDALRVIGETAQEEGLAGFVEVLGLAFLPGGIILPVAQKRVWAEATKPQRKSKKPAGLTYEEFFNFVDSYAREFFSANGFVYGMAPWLIAGSMEMVYQRKLGAIMQTIELSFLEGELKLAGGAITFYSEEVTSIIRKFDVHDKPQNYLTFFRKVVGDSEMFEERVWHINELKKALSSLLDALLARLNAIDSVESLAKVMLDDCHGDLEVRRKRDDFLTASIPDRAIICRLVNDPRFDELIEKFERIRFWGAAIEAKRRTVWPILLKNLREEYKPA